MKKIDLDEVKKYIDSQTPETKIYLGCDSERFKIDGQWYADYIVAIVVHINGNSGCKVFGEVTRERDYEQKRNRPRYRLMTEVYKAADMYLKLSEIVPDRDIEVHLDLNPDEVYGSSCAVQEAMGYIKGMCNVVPMIKPNAPAASYCADRFKSLKIA
jgi:predicted RNase H-related nuclease YkuK (DUF458 family)